MEWIKCGERMPNKDMVLFWSENIGMCIGFYFSDVNGWMDYRDTICKFRSCCVTHWMPLPQAPK